MRRLLALLAVLAISTPLAAQQQPGSRAERFLRSCDDYSGDNDSERFCEVRDVAMAVPSRALMVDGRENGGATIHGWDRNQVLVKAMIATWADSRAEAASMAKDIRILTDGERVRADGPSRHGHTHWSVSYEIWVPRKTSLEAETHNGGLRVDGIEGRVDLRAVNGGIVLNDVAGDVRAETTNGGVTATLAGDHWNGRGLDLETTNGSVSLDIPAGYNAELETGTVNGGMSIDFPITLQGTIGRRITTTLGKGGPRVRATTTNGSVRIRQRTP